MAEEQHAGPTWATASPALPAASEQALPAEVRIRAHLTGSALALAAIVFVLVVGLLIAAGPFHTSLGSIV